MAGRGKRKGGADNGFEDWVITICFIKQYIYLNTVQRFVNCLGRLHGSKDFKIGKPVF